MFKFFNKKKNQKGFTLIELLVVIAIIGVLSGIVIVAVGDATARARDSRRLADVRQLAFVLERETALGPAYALGVCTGANASTTACSTPVDFRRGDVDIVGKYFRHISDPGDPAAANFCGGATIADCNYSISSDPGVTGTDIRTNDYMICFALETDVPGPLGEGLNSIRTGARLVAGCP